MKVKTFHALLLSAVMVAGAVTINDAFAQTNTERLSTVVDTTSDTNDRVVQLTEIWNNFGNQFTPITDALNMVVAEVTAISGSISDLSDDVMATSAKVDAFEDKLDEYVATRASDSAELKAHVESLSDALPDIQNRISTLAGDASVGDLADKVDAITAQLNEFSSTLTTIQTEIESIQGELGVVKETAVTVTGEAPEDLNNYELEEDVKLAWYAHRLTDAPADHKYTANYNFVCQSDVFVTSVSSDIGVGTSRNSDPTGYLTTGTNSITFTYNNPTPDKTSTSTGAVPNPVFYNKINQGGADARTPHADMPHTTLKVGDTYVFRSNYERGGPTVFIFGADVNRNNGDVRKDIPHNFTNPMELKAGEPLVFESTTQERGAHADGTMPTALYYYAKADMNTDIAVGINNGTGVFITDETTNPRNTNGNVTKAQLGAATVYTVTVKYHSESADAQCKLTPADIAPLDNTDQTVFVSPDISGDGVLTKYTTSLDCDLNAVRITDVTADLTGATDYNNYVNMNLKIGDDTKAEFTFANNTSMLNEKYSYPIEFEAVDLTIEGDALVGSGLVIQFTYDTITGGACNGQDP